MAEVVRLGIEMLGDWRVVKNERWGRRRRACYIDVSHKEKGIARGAYAVCRGYSAVERDNVAYGLLGQREYRFTGVKFCTML